MDNQTDIQQITKGVQRCTMDVLSQVDRICKKYNLTYFGVGGTCLGAVRHQGFIPWDDDMDVGMPRADYEKFLEIAKRELPQGYHLQHFSTEPGSPFYFTKIRKDGTRFVEYYLKDCRIHSGIFVDIFPFDPIPDKAWQRKIHFRMCRISFQLYLAKTLDTVYSARFEQLGEDRKGNKERVRKILHTLLKPVPKAWLYRFMDGCLQWFRGRDTREIGYGVSRWLITSKEDLYPIRWLPFENMQIPVPGNYETYLLHKFGDYWELPPESERYGHLPYEVTLDTGEHYQRRI